MPTIVTVPGGSVGTTVSLTFATAASASLATSLLSSVYAAAVVGNLSNEFVITAGGAYTVPSTATTVVDAASGAVTLTGNTVSGEVIAVGTGPLAFFAPGGSGTVIAGGGSDTYVSQGGNYLTTGDATYSAFGVTSVAGNNTTVSVPTVPAGQTVSFPVTGNNDVIFGNGSGSENITNTGTGSTVVINATATTISAGAGSSGTYFASTGSLTFANSGSSTLVGAGSSGTATLFNPGSNFAFFQGNSTGSTTFVNSAGGTGVVIAGSAGGLSLFNAGGLLSLYGQSNNPNYLVGVSGTDTLNASGALSAATIVNGGAASSTVFLSNFTADTFFGGTGNATVLAGASGGAPIPDLFAFVSGSSGGSDSIFNFGSSSTLAFLGYGATGDAAIKAAIAAAGSGPAVAFTLPDNTKITLVGINSTSITPSTNGAFYS